MTTPKKPSQLAALRERIDALEKEVERLRTAPMQTTTVYHVHQWAGGATGYPNYYYPQRPYQGPWGGGLGVGTSTGNS